MYFNVLNCRERGVILQFMLCHHIIMTSPILEYFWKNSTFPFNYHPPVYFQLSRNTHFRKEDY